MREIDTIVVHCAAVPPDWRAGESVGAKRDEIDRWHRARGWDGIGYHAVIDRDGSIAQGRPDRVQGAHARGHNATSLAVCLIGGAESREHDSFADHYTPDQARALRRWIRAKRTIYPTIRDVIGHNQVAAKACPGFRVPLWLADAPAAPTQPDPAEQPAGPWAAIWSALARIFRRQA